MAVTTTGIGFIPSYATLGLWATVLLVLCRCLQGLAAGGELGGANAVRRMRVCLRHGRWDAGRTQVCGGLGVS
ncbi:hypothetical protein [Streptomyces sp. SAS_281]|uniref:hypothetical protein n=1 Tax=Streptomyces sp. SAS_281 TaxID=3412744 RepID=UPI00403CCD84